MNVPQVKKHLPSDLEAQRGSRGHITIKQRAARPGETKLQFEMDKSRFNNAAEMALYAQSLVPR